MTHWVAGHGGIVHRDAAAAAGYGVRERRDCVRRGTLRLLRRSWLATPDAPIDLTTAASAGGLVACVSSARRRGWWMPEGTDDRLHLRLAPHAASHGLGAAFTGVVHWTTAIAPAARGSLTESVEDTLAHVASCLAHETALIIWESAARRENLAPEALRGIRWRSRAAADLAHEVNGLSDSGLETIFVVRLRPWGIPIRQQIMIAGHRVDALIGERLIVQIDGFAHHSNPAQRGRDVAHDAELRLRGYTVLRFTYAQIVHDWPSVERLIARAIAAGAHRAA